MQFEHAKLRSISCSLKQVVRFPQIPFKMSPLTLALSPRVFQGAQCYLSISQTAEWNLYFCRPSVQWLILKHFFSSKKEFQSKIFPYTQNIFHSRSFSHVCLPKIRYTQGKYFFTLNWECSYKLIAITVWKLWHRASMSMNANKPYLWTDTWNKVHKLV